MINHPFTRSFHFPLVGIPSFSLSSAQVPKAASFIFSDLQGSSISTGLGRVMGTVFGGEKAVRFSMDLVGGLEHL